MVPVLGEASIRSGVGEPDLYLNYLFPVFLKIFLNLLSIFAMLPSIKF
jgi:hypothetical protein